MSRLLKGIGVRSNQCLLNPNIDLETRLVHHPEKGFVAMPSPFGEGLTNAPINRHNRGEVPQCHLEPTIDLEPRLAHHPEMDSSPCPLHLEFRGGQVGRNLNCTLTI